MGVTHSEAATTGPHVNSRDWDEWWEKRQASMKESFHHRNKGVEIMASKQNATQRAKLQANPIKYVTTSLNTVIGLDQVVREQYGTFAGMVGSPEWSMGETATLRQYLEATRGLLSEALREIDLEDRPLSVRQLRRLAGEEKV